MDTTHPRKSRVHTNAWLKVSAVTRISIAVLIGLIAGGLVGISSSWEYSPLVLWDITALVLLISLLFSVIHLTPDETAEFASREDPGRGVADVILIFASIASLIAVAVLIVQSGSAHGTAKILEIGLGLVSIVISWAVIHTVYMLRYADEYYKSKAGIDFNSTDAPRYSDFAYLAFTIGMTYQVSDTNLKTHSIRKIALAHALLSFLFGTAIIASAINFVAGLAK